jgi:hypothetical protein
MNSPFSPVLALIVKISCPKRPFSVKLRCIACQKSGESGASRTMFRPAIFPYNVWHAAGRFSGMV